MRYRRLPEVANLRLELRAGRLAQEDLDVAAHQPVRETVPKLPDRGVLGALTSPHEPVPQRTRRELRPFEKAPSRSCSLPTAGHGGRGLDDQLPLATHDLSRDDLETVQAEQRRPGRTTVSTHL